MPYRAIFLRRALACCVGLAACLALRLPASGQAVVLNEAAPGHVATLLDEDGDGSDWLELFNAGPEAVDLAGYGLSDDPDRPFRWTFGAHVLDAADHLVVFASGKDRPGERFHWETRVDRGDAWRYTTSATPPPADWYTAGFDDAAWQQGPSGFGYGDADDATTVPARTIVVFARTTFTVDDPEQVRQAYLHVDFDDAFVAYLNGEEIARAGIGTVGTPPGTAQAAGSEHEAGRYRGLPPEAFGLSDAATRLRPGENVLAVAVHNTSAGSSDLTLIPYLTLGLATPPAGARGLSADLDLPGEHRPHASFGLDAAGETLYLTAPDGTLLDSLAVPALAGGHSFGRRPDGDDARSIFVTPTPGAPNADEGYDAPVAAPTFDRPGGRYAATSLPVVLRTDAPGATIRYTLDGSEPTETSSVYTGPFVLRSTTVVRARSFAPGALPGPVTTETFLLSEDVHLPVVSLATAPKNLWDQQTGIYVMDPNASPQDPHYGANFWQDWEKPVHVALYEADRPGSVFAADAGVKIYGGWSRAHAQKSLALFARAGYGTGTFRHAFFPDLPIDAFESFILRNSGNDWPNTHFRDALMHQLLRDVDVDVLAYRPVVVFLNGEYWGIQNLREKVSEHFVAAHHGLNPDAVDLVELVSNAAQYAVIQGSDASLRAVLAYVETHDMTSAEDLAVVEAAVDLEQFIDYQVAQIFYANTDWPGNNVKLWRPQAEGGRWRWILYDTDFGFALYDRNGYRHATLDFATAASGPEWPNPPHSTLLFRRLLRNEAFRNAFVNRFADHLNATFDATRVRATIDAMEAAIAPEIPRHTARWGGSLSQWRNDVDVLRDFALRRPAFLWIHLRQFFGLEPNTFVSLDATAGGTIRVNRLDVDAFPWTGRYFPGVPVTLTALPRPGYRFAGWSADATAADASITVDPATTKNLVARFEPVEGAPPTVVLNEIFYNPPPDHDTEDWVELYNASPDEADLSGWTFRDADDADVFTIPAGTRLAPGGYLVLSRDPDAFRALHPGVASVTGGWSFGLSNGGDLLRLFDAAGTLADSVRYDDEAPWPAAPDGTGPSLELVDPASDNAHPEAWRSASVRGGTPGAPNSVATGAATVPQAPADLALMPVHPAPFTGTATLGFQLPHAGAVALYVYNAMGQRVATLVDGVLPAGRHTAAWEARGASPGLYLFQLVFDGAHRRTRTAVRLR